MRFMEWNIHGSGGYGRYNIPVTVIVKTIQDIKPDVIILLEFIEWSNGFYDLQNCMNKLDYAVFLTTMNNSNGVLIAVSNKFTAEKVEESIEFLEVKIKYNEVDWLNVIGMRILTQGRYSKFIFRKKTFDDYLVNLKKQNENFVMLFDANNGAIQSEKNKLFQYKNCERKDYSYQYIWRTVEDKYQWSLITPDRGGNYIGGKYSVVTGKNEPENYHTKEDHIISSLSEALFTKVDYYWDFVNKGNGYGNRTKKDLLSDLIGLPDHAVLVAELNLSTNIS